MQSAASLAVLAIDLLAQAAMYAGAADNLERTAARTCATQVAVSTTGAESPSTGVDRELLGGDFRELFLDDLKVVWEYKETFGTC